MTQTVSGATTISTTTNAVVIPNKTFSGSVTVSGKITTGGISVTGSSIGGSIIGTGTIAGGIKVDGASTIKVTSGTAILIEESTFSGGISNAGTISGGLRGIGLTGPQNQLTFGGGIDNTGVISGLESIVVTGALTFSGGISNGGTLSSSVFGIVFGNVGLVSGGFSNSGTISAPDGVGIAVGNVLAGAVESFAGIILNSGSITASTGISVYDSSVAGGITNSGNISGSGGVAIDLSDEDIGFPNFQSNGITVDQTAGTITGAIKLSSRADVLDISGGVVNGNIIGSGTSGTVEFTLGAGNSFTYSNIISGVNVVEIASGTLVLAPGASIIGNTEFTAADATLQFDTAVSQLEGAIAGAVAGDAIDLAFQPFVSGDQAVWQQFGSSGTLKLETSGGVILDSLALSGQYTSADFSVAADSNGGTDIDLGSTQGPPPSLNPSPPAGTTAVMIMNNPGNGDYEIYDVGGNQILAAYSLGQVGSPWSPVGLGTFQAADTADMLLRNSTTGAFEAYYVSNNNITGTANVGTVGTEWNFAGIGDFDGMSSLSELLLRNSSSGAFELYQVAGGGVLSGSAVGAVGGNFTVEGFGHFSESSTTQMLMQDNSGDASNGQLELYTYQPGSASFAGIDVGKVGSNLTFLGAADLLGNGSTQMVMQQNNGDIWLYTYNASANALSGTEVGAIGSNFHVVGFGPLGTSGQDEMLMQNASNGDFEVYQYNASENAFVGTAMGAVGSPWTVDGIAANSAASASTAQLVQAMASMSNGAAVSTANTPLAGAGTTQQTFLTTPHPA